MPVLIQNLKIDIFRKKVGLEVRITNSSGIRLYASAGFKIIRSASLYYHDGADAYVMAKKLFFSR